MAATPIKRRTRVHSSGAAETGSSRTAETGAENCAPVSGMVYALMPVLWLDTPEYSAVGRAPRGFSALTTALWSIEASKIRPLLDSSKQHGAIAKK